MEFTLFAPYNEKVELIGNWNHWKPIPMTQGADGVWRVDVPLKDGEYQYKFLVKSLSYFAEGQTLAVLDPYSTRVTRESDEKTILQIKNGKEVITSYQWKHDDVLLPPNSQLIIYELHIQDFTGGAGDDHNPQKGTFKGAIEKLDYLAELGINAIELMPVQEFPGHSSWGYNPRILFGVENNYGTPDDLCAFIDECHRRGIRVIFDGVFNHSEMASPLTQIDYGYWYYVDNPDPDHLDFGPKFNYFHHDTKLDVWPARAFVRDTLAFWIQHFHIDGIRFDATAAIRHYDILGWLSREAHALMGGLKPFITIAEHVPQDPTVAGSDGPMDAAWHETFSKQLMATLVMRDRDGRQAMNVRSIIETLDPRAEGFESSYNVINYIDNHDQERIMWQLGEQGIFDAAAFRRMRLGAGILLTSPGIPMLWMGQEFGESAPKTPTAYAEPQPLDWALLNNKNNHYLMKHYTGLLQLRRTMPALHEDTFQVIHVEAERGIFAYKRWNTQGNVVVVVVNIHDSYQGEIRIGNWPEDGTWHEYIYNYDVQVAGGWLQDSLGESEVKIYFKK